MPKIPGMPSLGARLAHLLRLGSKWGMLKLQPSHKEPKRHQASERVSSFEATPTGASSGEISAPGEAARFSPDQESPPCDDWNDQSGAPSSEQVFTY